MPLNLILDDWLSVREAEELLFYFIRWGEHQRHDLRQLPDGIVESILRAEGYPWDRTISDLQESPHRAIAFFENLASGGTWEFTGPPGSVVKHEWVVDGVSLGQTQIEEHGLIRMDYKAQFAAACRARDAAIEKADVDEFFTMLARGFASIESFLIFRAHVYNDGKADEDKLIDGDGGRFISTEEKFRQWIPKMTGGTLTFGKDSPWTKLKGIRNNAAIHPKIGTVPDRLDELASGINAFRDAIGSTMFALHQLFGREVQSMIIRAMRYPTVRVRRS